MGAPTWVWGVFLGFSGCVVSNLGINFQKLAHTKIHEAGSNQSYATHPVWILGITLMIVGSIADLVSFGFAPMSLLAPIGAMTLVVNMLVAPCFKEKLTTRDIVFTLVIVVGTVICISFGSKDEKTYSIQELLDLYTHPPFIVFGISLLLIMALLFFLINQSAQREAKFLHTQWDLKFQAVAYPAVAGAVAALSVLFAKSAAELVKSTVNGVNQFTNAFSYAMIVGLAATIFLQMKWLNIGLTKGDSLFVLPVYQVFWVTMNVVTGMIYFEDYKAMDWTHMFFFILGIVITLCGVYFLTQRSTGGSADDKNASAQIEAAVIAGDGSDGTSSRASDGGSGGGSRAELDANGGAANPAAGKRAPGMRRGPTFLLGFHMSVDDLHSPSDSMYSIGADLVPTVYIQNETKYSMISGL